MAYFLKKSNLKKALSSDLREFYDPLKSRLHTDPIKLSAM